MAQTEEAAYAQRMQALEAANQKRFARLKMKQRVHDGKLSVAKVIRQNPSVLQTSSYTNHPITIGEILTWQNGWGMARARKFCRALGVDASVQLHCLTESRRKMLARHLH